MKKGRFYKGLLLLTLSTKYLHLVKNVVGESIKQGNPHMLVTDGVITDKEYDEKTKWSDFHIITPVLFNFYHGLELVLKGFLILKNNYIPSHQIEKLFEEFTKNYSKEQKLISILEKYLIIDLMPDFLANCLRKNNIRINNLYEFLRYPTDKNFQKIYNYFDLKYKEEKGLNFFQQLRSDLDILLREMVKLYKEMEKSEIDNENKNGN